MENVRKEWEIELRGRINFTDNFNFRPVYNLIIPTNYLEIYCIRRCEFFFLLFLFLSFEHTIFEIPRSTILCTNFPYV